MNLSPYFRLMRLHQPAGIWLLYWPCAWSILLAAKDISQAAPLLVLFLVGSVLMRGAGCIINDMLDREFDRKVERTKSRPLASGELSMPQAGVLLGVLLFISLLIAVSLGAYVLKLSLLALIPVALYPLMKRITWWPQLFLGLTFNLGALIGGAAVQGYIGLPALLLYSGGVFWTLGYDTIYAHQDKEDDARIGVKSTARRLGESTDYWLIAFYDIALLFFFLAGYVADAGAGYFVGLAAFAALLIYQVLQLEIYSPSRCMRLFRLNQYAGLVLFLGIVVK